MNKHRLINTISKRTPYVSNKPFVEKLSGTQNASKRFEEWLSGFPKGGMLLTE